MSQPLHRRLSVFFIAAAASFATWHFLPSTGLDRGAFRFIIANFANPPHLISGSGTHADPWTFRTTGLPTSRESGKNPPLVAITDDPDGIFQASPPSPVDLAVILQNIKRLGASGLSIAAVLAWDAPDPIGLAALDRLLASLTPLTTAAPVTRSATPAPIPAPFRSASLPPDAIHGDITALPIVNRLPIPTVILGGENARAGFTTIESEPAHKAIPMIAIWDERLIFSFPVIATLAQLNLEPEDLEIRLGEFIRFGVKGPTIPIDHAGRFTPPPATQPPTTPLPAAELIDADSLPGMEITPVLLDLQSAADPFTRSFSATLPGTLEAILTEAGLTRPTTYGRLAASVELALLLVFAAAAALFPATSRFATKLVFAGLATLAIASQWLGVGLATTWLPALPILGGTLAAAAFVLVAPPAKPSVAREKPKKLPPAPKPAAPPPATAPPAPAKNPPAKPAKSAAPKPPQKKATGKAHKKPGRRK